MKQEYSQLEYLWTQGAPDTDFGTAIPTCSYNFYILIADIILYYLCSLSRVLKTQLKYAKNRKSMSSLGVIIH